eukprot:scaffold22365_cov102-Isochrysis_galbana.AAC.2
MVGTAPRDGQGRELRQAGVGSRRFHVRVAALHSMGEKNKDKVGKGQMRTSHGWKAVTPPKKSYPGMSYLPHPEPAKWTGACRFGAAAYHGRSPAGGSRSTSCRMTEARPPGPATRCASQYPAFKSWPRLNLRPSSDCCATMTTNRTPGAAMPAPIVKLGTP